MKPDAELAQAAIELAEKAQSELARVCKNDFRMRVAIPARPGVDSDLIFSDAFEAGEKAGRALLAATAKVERYEKALNQIAAWSDGETVGSHFDEPGSAGLARAALAGTEPT